MKSYVKEVERLIEEGLNEQVAVQTFQMLVNRFADDMHRPELEDFKLEIAKARKDDRAFYRSIIDEGCGAFPFPIEMSWRNVKFEPKRVKRCAICSDYYYDVSRNGGSVTCYNNGICANEYEIRRKRAGTILEPAYRRKVQEIPTDFSPKADDAQANAFMNKVEMTAWRNRVEKAF
ncbi:hypothetical protein KM915_10350 [Cytobacillus oceanisediminis]|uniref:hypothetical protein n=1 Tax=Cytobacillus oceanisediminis TaxID=665099 RepID=UPI001C2366B2|nr:hypothetical protein [Cytobacillus oceanisediminis]MBU8730454.1 hypothetical protein [Cytobacillus oceanisediminis]